MRQVCTSAVAVCLMASSAAGADDRVGDLLSATRAAILGPSGDADVRGLSMSGQGTRAVGPMQMAGSFDLHLVLPERFVRVDRLSVAGVKAEIASGFDGTALIQRARGADGVRMDPDALMPAEVRDSARAAAVAGAKQELGLLLLGLLADSFPFHPWRFAYEGIADAPDGSADVILATGPTGFTAHLFVDTRTHLPLMVSWQAPDVLGAFRRLTTDRPGVAPSRADIERLGQGALVEHRLSFGQHRRSGALTWPSVVRRSVAGTTTEEIAIERLVLNPAIDARVFETGR